MTCVDIKNMPEPYISAKGDGVTDDTSAIQAAVTNFKTIFFPVGTYLISDTIREATNGGQRQLIGENQFATVIKASSSMTNKPLVWFGNSNGHGNYRGHIKNITFDGYDKANNNIGIRWHEAGTSITRDVKITNCGIGIQALGCIAHTIDGNGYISSCTKGIMFTRIPHGTPSSVDDITVTASPLSLSTNISKIFNVWFVGCDEEAIRIEGGLFQLRGCTFQSAANGGANYDIVSVINANESFDYGGGPIIEANWFEGGDYRYMIAVRDTRAVRIRDNFFSGNGAQSEGAILLSNADNAIVTGNSFRGGLTRTPSEGRLANAVVYVTPSTRAYTCQIESNYITKNILNVYYEGVATPNKTKPRIPHWATISIGSGVPTIEAASSDFISTVGRDSVGKFRVTYPFNRETMGTGKYPSICFPFGSGGTTYMVTKVQQNNSYDVFAFTDQSGTLIDPEGFTVVMFGDTLSI